MNIKSLLLGSAAALVAVSGARAADAVMAEPEAVEYVRVCDAYGAGYFYIPGTETCLKIGGRVRYQINFSDNDNGWRKQAQGLLHVTAKSDTELGTLTSYIEMEANRLSGRAVFLQDQNGAISTNGGFVLAHAWISLGGLKMGYSDSLFDGGINGEFDSYGGRGVHFMGYTFTASNGLSFTLNLEEEDDGVNYVPNVVAKLSYSQGMFGLNAWAAYDDEDVDAFGNTAEFALKAIATIKASDPFTIQIGATYNSGPSHFSNGYDWSLGASGKYQVNEKLALTAGAQYFANAFGTSNDKWTAGIVANYTIVPQFTTELAVNYDSAAESTSGYLRFQREF